MIIPKRELCEPLGAWCHRLAIANDGIKGSDLYELLKAVSKESYLQGGDDAILSEARIEEEL